SASSVEAPRADSISRRQTSAEGGVAAVKSDEKEAIWLRTAPAGTEPEISAGINGSKSRAQMARTVGSRDTSTPTLVRTPRRVCHSSVRSSWVTGERACFQPADASGDRINR